MMATKVHRFASRGLATNAMMKVLRQQQKAVVPSVHTLFLQPCHGFSTKNDSESQKIIQNHVHKFSTMVANAEAEPGIIEKRLQALDMGTVRKIKSELMAVDANSDGRIDAEELKQLLKRHSASFTDEQVIEIGELFYAAKAGESVSFDRFIQAIDRVAASAAKLPFDDKPMTEHFKESEGHPLGIGNCAVEFLHTTKTHHGYYTPEELDVALTHTPPKDFSDRLANNAVKALRKWFDLFTGWKNDNITVNNILNRTIYLETIAAVPGMVAAVVRHFRSLRSMKADGGYMQLFLEEANNER